MPCPYFGDEAGGRLYTRMQQTATAWIHSRFHGGRVRTGTLQGWTTPMYATRGCPQTLCNRLDCPK
jgi:hypothetical protein